MFQVDGEDRRRDLTHEVRSPGRRIIIGSVEEGLDGHSDRRGGVEIRLPQLLQCPSGEAGARADGVEAVFDVSAAGDVEAEYLSLRHRRIDAGEQGHDAETLHGQSEVAAQHRGQTIGLAVEGQPGPFDLLVVFEFEPEEADEVECDPGRSGNADDREVVGGFDLLHRMGGDEVADRRSPVPGHEDTGRGAEADDRCAFRRLPGQVPTAVLRQRLGSQGAGELDEGIARRAQKCRRES